MPPSSFRAHHGRDLGCGSPLTSSPLRANRNPAARRQRLMGRMRGTNLRVDVQASRNRPPDRRKGPACLIRPLGRRLQRVCAVQACGRPSDGPVASRARMSSPCDQRREESCGQRDQAEIPGILVLVRHGLDGEAPHSVQVVAGNQCRDPRADQVNPWGESGLRTHRKSSWSWTDESDTAYVPFSPSSGAEVAGPFANCGAWARAWKCRPESRRT